MYNTNKTNDIAQDVLLQEHRRSVLLSGNLSDFQLQNLQTWPFMVFGDDLLEASIDYDFTTKSADGRLVSPGIIVFDFKFKDDKYIVNTKHLENLSLFVKFMFWSDTEVKFKIREEEIVINAK